MNKVKKVMLSIVGVIILLVVGTWVYHTIVAPSEIKATPAPGKLVNIEGHQMHVYAEGENDTTIVFMSGGGTSAPLLDFKPLWSRLSSSLAFTKKRVNFNKKTNVVT